ESERQEYHSALAKAAFELHLFAEAEQAYRKALLLNPDNCETWLDLAWFLLERMRTDEALEVLAEANQALVEAELQYSYVAVLMLSGRRQQALQTLSEILAEAYAQHSYLFDWLPDLRRDKDVLSLLDLHRSAG
ncbi:MAG: tetratricopeptide repeat protein, partial [Bacteroidetes bacterium]